MTALLCLLLCSTPIPGIDRIAVDGLPLEANVVLVDPRPLFDGDGQPLEIVVDVVTTSDDLFIIRFERPLACCISADLSPWAGVECIYTVQFDPPTVYGDVNRNGVVTTTDVQMVIANQCSRVDEHPASAICDLDRDGDVDEDDVALCMAQIGE